MTVSLIILFTVVYGILMGHSIEERKSKRAANLFKSLLLIGIAFLCTYYLNILSVTHNIDRDTYDSNYAACFGSAVIGCFYLFPVMMGYGKKKKNKIYKDAFE
jgi:hypothetical protein